MIHSVTSEAAERAPATLSAKETRELGQIVPELFETRATNRATTAAVYSNLASERGSVSSPVRDRQHRHATQTTKLRRHRPVVWNESHDSAGTTPIGDVVKGGMR